MVLQKKNFLIKNNIYIKLRIEIILTSIHLE
jgi:hypothetical protein